MLIGETAKKISENTKNEINLPWQEISAFRNMAIHDYYNLDSDIVWNTIIEDLPIIKKRLKEYLSKHSEN